MIETGEQTSLGHRWGEVAQTIVFSCLPDQIALLAYRI